MDTVVAIIVIMALVEAVFLASLWRQICMIKGANLFMFMVFYLVIMGTQAAMCYRIYTVTEEREQMGFVAFDIISRLPECKPEGGIVL